MNIILFLFERKANRKMCVFVFFVFKIINKKKEESCLELIIKNLEVLFAAVSA
jgi:hypothetical protein